MNSTSDLITDSTTVSFSLKNLLLTEPKDEIQAEIVPKDGPVIEVIEDAERERLFTMDEVRENWSMDRCWIVIQDVVYDITQFITQHPGGEEVLLEYGGGDASAPFAEMGHSIDAIAMLEIYRIGRLVKEQCTHNLRG